MLYAKIVLGLPVEGPFDYIVPENLSKKICTGQRVAVSFGRQKKTAYVVKLSHQTSIKNLKTILKLLDKTPVLDKNMLLFTRRMSQYYCCSWGEAIETALPIGLRQGKIISLSPHPNPLPFGKRVKDERIPILVQALETKERWDKVYLPKIRETIDNKQSVIILLPDTTFLPKAQAMVENNFNCRLTVLYRNHPDELNKWILIKELKTDIVIGTRSAVFSPFNNLGLIIVDEENMPFGYKQDQSPHYDARQIAYARADIDKAGLILGGKTISLERICMARKNRAEYISIPSLKNLPEVKIIDTKGIPLIPTAQFQHFNRNRPGQANKKSNLVLSNYIQSSIMETLNSPPQAEPEKGKTLLFYNRLGFATIASCPTCAAILKCQRCNVNLVFHYKENKLRCHRCNFEIAPPKICPNCNSNYIRYWGAGTEKIESEFSRLFPQAKIEKFDPNQLTPAKKSENGKTADIFISTQAIIKEPDLNFSLIAALSVDNLLNHTDFRASEKTFDILYSLMNLTDKKIVIQTNLPNHYIFKALTNKDLALFYNEELKTRRQLKLPPYRHLAIVKLRGKNEEKVKTTTELLFNLLNNNPGKKNPLTPTLSPQGGGPMTPNPDVTSGLWRKRMMGKIEIISMNPGYPSKLRGNFYRQILLKSKSAFQITEFLKINLRNFSHSGIIITVDMDPI